MADVDFLGRGWKLAALTQTITNLPQSQLQPQSPVSRGLAAGVEKYGRENHGPLTKLIPDLELIEGEESIREAILIILGTRPGERVMRPDFGCNLQELVFAPNNTATATLAEFHVSEALQKWEPRIEILKVTADPGTERERLDIRIEYRVNSTNTRNNLVYPFYLERADE